MKKTLFLLLFFFVFSMNAFGASAWPSMPDPVLEAAIADIKAVDDHAHPLCLLKAGQRDKEWSDLSYHVPGVPSKDTVARMPVIPYRLRPKSPEYHKAWQALYGLPHASNTQDFIKDLMLAKQKRMNEQGANYSAWVLDQLGIETMLANRVVMPKNLAAPRFRWIAYVDALMYPLAWKKIPDDRPDLVKSYASLERLLEKHMMDLKIEHLPQKFEKYLDDVITPTIERMKQDGAVGVKFQTAYVRTLDITNPSQRRARKIYERHVGRKKPSASEYKTLQDFLFRYIAREAGRLHLPVQIHTGIGIGVYFDVAGSDPMLLEDVFNDSSLRSTNFVLLHGGWPFAQSTKAMLLKPNVHADFSAMNFMFYPQDVSTVLRSWLEIAPDKVLFGTDGFELDPDMPFISWEEFSYIAVRSTRHILAEVLTAMMQDQEITQEEAIDIARHVMRENAIALYGLK